MQSSAPTSFQDHYLQGHLAELFQLAPGDTAGALRLPRPVDREALVTALRRYARKLAAPEAVYGALENLAHPQSRVIVTGQQTGLLLGPLYTLSKAVTAVTLARSLTTEARPVVPIFWLASQDADSAEIDHAYVLDNDETLHRLSLPLPEEVSAGRIALPKAWLQQIVQQLGTLNVATEHRRASIELLTRTAAQSETVADWFGAVLYELLGGAGLIVLNPLEADLAELFRPVLEAELADPLRSAEHINTAAEAVRRRGFSPQLGRGAGATNLFLEEGGLRRPLRYAGGVFVAESSSYSAADLRAKLAADPSRLTPAAGLRPITQDAVLPTAATVVGPGELRYFAQLRGVYEHHGAFMPLIWPRATVTVLEPPVRRILETFKLSASELQRDYGAVRDRKLLELHGHKSHFDESLSALKRLSEALTRHVSEIDPTLSNAVTRAEADLHATFAKLERKSAAALATRDDIYTRQFERLRAQLLPTGAPQERVLSPFSFFLKFGIQNVVEAFLALPPEGNHEIRF